MICGYYYFLLGTSAELRQTIAFSPLVSYLVSIRQPLENGGKTGIPLKKPDIFHTCVMMHLQYFQVPDSISFVVVSSQYLFVSFSLP